MSLHLAPNKEEVSSVLQDTSRPDQSPAYNYCITLLLQKVNHSRVSTID